MKAKIELVHVYGFEIPLPEGIAPPEAGAKQETEALLRRYLNKFARSFGLKEPRLTCHIRRGSAFDEICKVAREIDADLIVTSTHGYTGWKRIFLGSIAERIVRHAPCPVLIARRAGPGHAHPPSLHKLLVPLDFSRKSLKGLEVAVQVGRRFDASLSMLHVVNEDPFMTADGGVTYAEPEMTQRVVAEAKERLHTFIGRSDLAGVHFTSAVRSLRGGITEDEICSYAHRNGIDLIVTTTHGRTGLSHALLGSIAEHVVRYAKGPVLVVPTRQGARG